MKEYKEISTKRDPVLIINQRMMKRLGTSGFTNSRLREFFRWCAVRVHGKFEGKENRNSRILFSYLVERKKKEGEK